MATEVDYIIHIIISVTAHTAASAIFQNLNSSRLSRNSTIAARQCCIRVSQRLIIGIANLCNCNVFQRLNSVSIIFILLCIVILFAILRNIRGERTTRNSYRSSVCSALINSNSITLSNYLAALNRYRYIAIFCICMNSCIIQTAGTIAPRAGITNTLRSNHAIINDQRTTIDCNTASLTVNNTTIDSSGAFLRIINRIISSRFQNTAVYSNITIMI